MANNYINLIVDVLKDLDNNAHPEQLYKDLAWFGLEGTSIYATTTLLTDSDRLRIEGDRTWAEVFNLPTNTVQPSTPPCN